MMSLWEPWYKGKTSPEIFGEQKSYELAAAWLASAIGDVQDRGCGLGWFGHVAGYPVLGIDGTAGPFTDVVADLCEYRRPCQGIHIRHVLEHNERWQAILRNAISDFEYRFVLTICTRLSPKTEIVGYDPVGTNQIPVISLGERELQEVLLSQAEITWYRQWMMCPESTLSNLASESNHQR